MNFLDKCHQKRTIDLSRYLTHSIHSYSKKKFSILRVITMIVALTLTPTQTIIVNAFGQNDGYIYVKKWGSEGMVKESLD